MVMTFDIFLLQISEISVIIDQISKENFVLTEEKDVLTVCIFMYLYNCLKICRIIEKFEIPWENTPLSS